MPYKKIRVELCVGCQFVDFKLAEICTVMGDINREVFCCPMSNTIKEEKEKEILSPICFGVFCKGCVHCQH